jgi:hypothetical protein
MPPQINLLPEVGKFVHIQLKFHDGFPWVFLSNKVSNKLGYKNWGWQDAKIVYITSVNDLQDLHSGKFATPSKGTFIMPPPEDLLCKVILATTTAIEMAIEEYKKMDVH